MKCQIMFSGKIKKYISKMLSVENTIQHAKHLSLLTGLKAIKKESKLTKAPFISAEDDILKYLLEENKMRHFT